MKIGEEFYRKLLDSIHDGVYFVDRNRTIQYWNKGAERLAGYSAKEIIGSKCANNLLVHVNEHGQELCRGACPLLMTMEDGKDRTADIYLHHKNGHRIPVTVQAAPILDENGATVGCMEVFRENYASNNEWYIRQLEAVSLLDPLTQIANRRYIESKLMASVHEFQRYTVPFGMLFADIDRFKTVNDTFGHLVGDDVLKMVSQSLAKNIRLTDFVGRWGGEEFVVIAPHISLAQLRKLAEKLRLLMEKSFLRVGDTTVKVTLTMGATCIRPDDTEQTLLARADRLMYRGKQSGRNQVVMET
ncbi:MAG TPA: GGDEF domain-containing protein [Dissulfurispiraceae bacterium]|nr:GGDEF domain-containing protein [Dissulfurispiraceae bacterium]